MYQYLDTGYIWIYKSEHGYINLHENGFVIIITLLILHLRHH